MVSVTKLRKGSEVIDTSLFETDSTKLNKDVFEELVGKLFQICCKELSYNGYKIYLFPKDKPKFTYIVKLCNKKEKIINFKKHNLFMETYLECINRKVLSKKILTVAGMKNLHELRDICSKLSLSLLDFKNETQFIDYFSERCTLSDLSNFLFYDLDKIEGRTKLLEILKNKKKHTTDMVKSYLNYKTTSLDTYLK